MQIHQPKQLSESSDVKPGFQSWNLYTKEQIFIVTFARIFAQTLSVFVGEEEKWVKVAVHEIALMLSLSFASKN